MSRSRLTPKPNQPASWCFEAIGTRWAITIWGGVATAQTKRAVDACIAAYDAVYSRFREDSTVASMSRTAGSYTLPEHSSALFELLQALYELTDGAMSPLIGDALVDSGYDSTYSLVPQANIRPTPGWSQAMSFHQGILHLKQPATIDVGAAGKGQLVDLVAAILAQHNVQSFMIDAGGDILVHGAEGKPVRVGLENPFDAAEAIGVVELNEGAICASATNRRSWGDLHHILDARTGRPATGIAATWVRAQDCLHADALATALFFCAPEKLQKRYNFEYVLVNKHQQVLASKGMASALFA